MAYIGALERGDKSNPTVGIAAALERATAEWASGPIAVLEWDRVDPDPVPTASLPTDSDPATPSP